ncbi:MAG: N-acetylmuramoyl-L-alanine amidase [Proteobacteria bacterium]|nr:N-acetylmuramoyl-L-alanine amidase [Pseudomonadota bacterium]
MHCPRLAFLAILVILSAALTACAPMQIDTTLPVSRAASPNFDARRPNLIVIHHTTDNTLEEAQATLTSPQHAVSAHFLIGRDGRIVQLVAESARAWHAGLSWWGGQTDVNSASIGIELDNNGHEPYAAPQITALLSLLADLRQRYRIPAANVIGHADVAPARKVDPSALFPWDVLARQGFGLWCEPPLPPAPPGFDLALGLTALGYDPRVPDAARRAFRLHYVRGAEVTEEGEKALAACLLRMRAAERD